MFFKRQNEFKLFDEEYYTKSYPDVKESGLDPHRHFLRIGVGERRNPCAVFDTEYYLSQVGSVTTDPTEHYQKHGISIKAEPHPTFDREWYLRNNPDVVADGADPLWHYFRYGRAEGRKSGPAWRNHFAGAKRPLWRLAAQRPARRAVHMQFGYGDVPEPAQSHAVYGLAVYMTPSQVSRLGREQGGYRDFLRAEIELTPNVVIILSNVTLSSATSGGTIAKYDTGHVFSLESSDSSPVCVLGAGRLALNQHD